MNDKWEELYDAAKQVLNPRDVSKRQVELPQR